MADDSLIYLLIGRADTVRWWVHKRGWNPSGPLSLRPLRTWRVRSGHDTVGFPYGQGRWILIGPPPAHFERIKDELRRRGVSELSLIGLLGALSETEP